MREVMDYILILCKLVNILSVREGTSVNHGQIRKPEGFIEEKLYVLPEYWMKELEQEELTASLFITDIGYFPNAQYHYRERGEGSASHIFIFCEAGEGWVELNHGEQMTMQPGDMVIIRRAPRTGTGPYLGTHGAFTGFISKGATRIGWWSCSDCRGLP